MVILKAKFSSKIKFLSWAKLQMKEPFSLSTFFWID